MWITVHLTITQNAANTEDTKVMLALNILSALVLLLVGMFCPLPPKPCLHYF